MREFVGVRSCFEKGNFGIGNWFSPQYTSSLKNQSLLFDKIGIVNLEAYLIPVRVFEPDNPHLLDLEFLQDRGIVFDYNVHRTWSDAARLLEFHRFLQKEGMGDYPMKVNSDQLKKINATTEFVKEAQSITERRLSELLRLDPNNPAHSARIEELLTKGIPAIDHLVDQARERMLENDSGEVRLVALWMSKFENSEVIPLLPYEEYLHEIPGSKKTEAVNIVIKELPIPDEETPWEKIIEYRNGPYFKKDREDLRGWIANISYSNLPEVEIAEQLERLMKKYREHLEVHDIRWKVGILETLIKVPLGILSHILQFDFAKIADPLFEIIRGPILLWDAEANAPGKEISYIIKTQDAFN